MPTRTHRWVTNRRQNGLSSRRERPRCLGSLTVTGRGWGLLGGGALTLLLAAWVSATGPVAVFARQDLTSSRAKARGIDYRVDAGTSEGQKLSDGLPGPRSP